MMTDTLDPDDEPSCGCVVCENNAIDCDDCNYCMEQEFDEYE